MSKTKEKALKFEEAIARLEEIVGRIESGEIGLEESLAAYEQGMKLVGHCRSILEVTEQKIGELKVDGKGRLRDVGGPTQETDPQEYQHDQEQDNIENQE